MMLGYIRVSTADQVAGTSPADQERVIRGLAMMRGVSGMGLSIFSDPGVSASVPLANRPAGKEMLAALQSGDIVCASKLDRLFRSASDALNTVEKLQKKGVTVILADISSEPVTENGVAKLFFTILSAVAEFERVRIADRMADGRKGKRAKFNGTGLAAGPAPRGWRKVGEGRDARLEPDENEQKIIRTARALVRKHSSVWAIGKELNRMGFRDRAGNEFRVPQVVRMLQRGRE